MNRNLLLLKFYCIPVTKLGMPKEYEAAVACTWGEKAKSSTYLIKAIMNFKNIDGALTIRQAQDNVCSHSPMGETKQMFFLLIH